MELVENRPIFILGAKTGGFTALLYSLGVTLFVISENISGYQLTIIQKFNWIILIFGLEVLAGVIVSLFSSLLGGITALIEFKILKMLKVQVTEFRALVIGFLICLCFTYPINQFFWPLSFDRPLDAAVSSYYLMIIGLPSLLYIMTGGWMGFKIANNFINNEAEIKR